MFALLARRHEWLIAGALAASLTYSGVAAIHGCLMVWLTNAYGDLDIVAITAILTSSAILLVPLLNWSKTIRGLGLSKDQDSTQPEDSTTRTLIVYWGFLVVVGMLSCLIPLLRIDFGNIDKAVAANGAWVILTLGNASTTSCVPPSGALNMSVGQIELVPSFVMTKEWLDENNCGNPCTSALLPISAFRVASDLVPVNVVGLDQSFGASARSLNSAKTQFETFYFGVGFFVIFFVVAQGAFVACFGKRSPRQIRDFIYLVFADLRIPFRKHQSPIGQPSQRRVFCAKWAALSVYLYAVFTSVLSIPLLILNMVASELVLNPLPENENHVHIGAWSPYAATGLVLLAAFLARSV
jgi:hypothetical protein